MVESPNYYIDDLRDYMDACFSALSSRDPKVAELKTESIPFAPWEADWFLRGVRDLHLFDVVVHDCRSGFIASGFIGDLFSTPSGKPRDAHFFSVTGLRGTGARSVSREGITHMASIAKLVGMYGYEPSVIRSESARFEVDIVAYDRPATEPEARPILGAEVKVREREHEALAIGMQACAGQGDADSHRAAVREQSDRNLPIGHAGNHHKKCRWLAAERPHTFWIVSTDRSDVFSVRFPHEGSFELNPLDEAALHHSQVAKRTS